MRRLHTIYDAKRRAQLSQQPMPAPPPTQPDGRKVNEQDKLKEEVSVVFIVAVTNRFLALKTFNQDQWNIPSHKRREGKPIADSAVITIHEDTGFYARKLVKFHAFSGKNNRFSCYLAFADNEFMPVVNGKDSTDARWVRLLELAQISHPLNAQIIETVCAKNIIALCNELRDADPATNKRILSIQIPGLG